MNWNYCSITGPYCYMQIWWTNKIYLDQKSETISWNIFCIRLKSRLFFSFVLISIFSPKRTHSDSLHTLVPNKVRSPTYFEPSMYLLCIKSCPPFPPPPLSPLIWIWSPVLYCLHQELSINTHMSIQQLYHGVILQQQSDQPLNCLNQTKYCQANGCSQPTGQWLGPLPSCSPGCMDSENI